MMRYIHFSIFLLSMVGTATAQEHPFLAKFELSPGFGTVDLKWTMIAGNTCQGIDILRSTNGIDFEYIGDIPGICGNLSQPVEYLYVDDDPLELTTLYYRLNLGSSGTSSIQSIDLRQITTGEYRFFPSPVMNNGTLVLRVAPNTSVDLRVFDARGITVLDLQDRVGPAIDLELNGLPAGTYYFEARTPDQKIKGNFVKLGQ